LLDVQRESVSKEEKPVIKGVHTMFYSSEVEALREFIREKLEFSYTDVGDGWLIFDLPEADMGCHPADENGTHGKATGTHDISFYCDDIETTVNRLKARSVEFTSPIQDVGYGFATYFNMPGKLNVQLYQPRYTKNQPSQ